MNLLKGIFWTVMLLISLVLFINFYAYIFLYFPIIPEAHQLYKDGLIVRIPQLDYVMVFAHGGYNGPSHQSIIPAYEWWGEDLNNINWSGKYPDGLCGMSKMDKINNICVDTLALINHLKSEGYENIWLSQCGTGDNEFITYEQYYDETGFSKLRPIEWPEDVSRKESPGVSFPVWSGWFWRL